MKKLFILLLLISSLSGISQWIPVTSLEGCNITDIEYLSDSSIITTGCAYNFSYGMSGGYGVIKRDLDNLEWSNPLPSGYFTRFIFCKNYTFIYSGKEIYRSEDFGNTWEYVNSQNTIGNMAAQDTVLYYAGTKNYASPGLYKSVDYGQSFELLYAGTNSFIRSVFTTSKYLYYHESEIGLLVRSSDGGKTWETVSCIGLPDFYNFSDIYEDKANNMTWASSQEGIFTISDITTSWTLHTNGFPKENPIVYDLENISGILYSSGNCGIFKYDTSAHIWMDFSDGLEGTLPTSMVNKGDAFFCGTNVGIYKKDVGSDQWTFFNDGENRMNAYNLLKDDSKLWMTTPNDVYMSENQGLIYKKKNDSCLPGIFSLYKNTDSLYITAANLGLFVSGNSGASWQDFTYGLGSIGIYDMAFPGNDLLVLTFNTIYYYYKPCQTWLVIPNVFFSMK